MKWLYFILAIVGGLVPPAIFFVTNYHRRDPDAILDLGLVFFSFGITILVIPLGVAGGLAVAVVAHVVYNRLPGRRRSTFTRWSVSAAADSPSAPGKPEED